MAKKKDTQQGKQLPIVPSDLDKSRWIRTPLVYARQGATLNRMQTDVMLMVSEKLQTYINGFYADGRDKLDQIPNSAVPDSAFHEPDYLLPIRLEMDEIVDKYHYDRLEEAVKDMSTLELRVMVREQKKNDQGALLYDVQGNPILIDVYKVMPLFSLISIPKFENDTHKRKGYIDLKINREVAKTVFDMNHGFVEHLARIAKYSQTDATTKVYLLLKAKMFQQHKSKIVVPMVELKTATGHIIYDKKTGKMLSETYLKWSEYKRRILEPVQKDLDKMALANKTEFSFRFIPLYNNGKTRGTPDNIEFTIFPSQLGLAHKKSKGKAPQIVERDLFSGLADSRDNVAQRDWDRLLESFHSRSGLSALLRRAEFKGAMDVTDKKGRRLHMFAVTITGSDNLLFNTKAVVDDYELFLKKIPALFGSAYAPGLYVLTKKE